MASSFAQQGVELAVGDGWRVQDVVAELMPAQLIGKHRVPLTTPRRHVRDTFGGRRKSLVLAVQAQTIDSTPTYFDLVRAVFRLISGWTRPGLPVRRR